MSLPSLRDLLAQHFDLEELCQLCFDLDIEYENLPGVTRKAKAQALVEYCLRHNCLPGLNTHCRELRPNVNWPNLDNLVTELSKVEQAITAQKALRGILPEEQVRTSLNPLQEKQINLLTQLLGSSSITGSNNNLIIQQFIHIYQEGGSCVVRGELNRAIDRYATWVMEYYGRVPLRGLSDREYQLPDPDLSHVYVSLVAQREGGRRQANRQRLIDMSKLPNQDSFHDYFSQVAQEAAHPQEERQDLADLRNLPNQELLPDFFQQMALEEVVHWQEERQGLVDMGNLLSQGPRLVITGRPGSGKTTFLRYIAYLLGYAIHTGDDKAVRQQLNLEGSLPLPIYVSLADYHRYCQKNRDLTLIDFISHTLIKQHGVYNLPNDFFAKMLSQENTVCLLLGSVDI